MKLRNSLLAVATAGAVIAAGVTANAQDNTTTEPPTSGAPTTTVTIASTTVIETTTVTAEPTTVTETVTAEPTTTANASSDPKQIQAWIGVATAIIGVLSTLFTFVSKNFPQAFKF